MNATLEPLEGKYYGTVVRVHYGPGEYEYREVNFWFSDLSKSRPSTREMGTITVEEWEKNPLTDYVNEDGEKMTIHEIVNICDSHWESQMALDLAELFIKAVNEKQTI